MINFPLAVTLDTNIFHAAKYDFSERSDLSLLVEYVEKGRIKLFLSDIVVQEAKRHIIQQVDDAYSCAQRFTKDLNKMISQEVTTHFELDRLYNFVKNKKEQERLKEKRVSDFDRFLRRSNAQLLKAELIDLEKVIDDYFQMKPPFENNTKKRKEFPDAFIASQINNMFGDDETIAIISNDNGFVSACQTAPNHLFFDSLRKLYDCINQEEVSYEDTFEMIKELKMYISFLISEYIKDNNSIDVQGLSYDKDGIESGFDYNAFYVDSVFGISIKEWTVDEISERTFIATLLCNAKIVADCFYEDYDNAPWDSEKKEFVFVNTINNKEKHSADFSCRIEIDRKTKEVKIYPFTISLSDASMENRRRVDELESTSYDQEFYDMEREEMGFIALNKYESFLEDNLSNSRMEHDIVQLFKKINTVYRNFDDFMAEYDALIRVLETDNTNAVAIQLSEKLKDISDFPAITNDSIPEEDKECILQWCKDKLEKAERVCELGLPDTINFGETIVIQGLDLDKLLLTIDEIRLNPKEGEEETIAVSISNMKEKIGEGQISLIVGYQHFDDEGQATDGLEDSIDYDYSEIIDTLCGFLDKQYTILNQEKDIFSVIESVINCYE